MAAAPAQRYREVRLLGKGGFGSATLVEERVPPTGRLLVVKEVRLAPRDAKAAEDAKREARFLRALQHPNIVAYVDSFLEHSGGAPGGGGAGAAPTAFKIVMEYADGGDLNQRIQQLAKAQPAQPR